MSRRPPNLPSGARAVASNTRQAAGVQRSVDAILYGLPHVFDLVGLGVDGITSETEKQVDVVYRIASECGISLASDSNALRVLDSILNHLYGRDPAAFVGSAYVRDEKRVGEDGYVNDTLTTLVTDFHVKQEVSRYMKHKEANPGSFFPSRAELAVRANFHPERAEETDTDRLQRLEQEREQRAARGLASAEALRKRRASAAKRRRNQEAEEKKQPEHGAAEPKRR